MRHLLLVSALAFVSASALAQTDSSEPSAPPAIATDPGYSSQFRCPESYPDEDSRRIATKQYLDWASQAHPGWRVDDTMNYRETLLRAHSCTETLNTQVDNEPHTPR
jgi:hypothetical protein